MMHEKIKVLNDDGTLKALIRAGLVSPKILMYYEIHAKFSFYISRGYKTNQAVIKTAMTVNVSERTVYKAIKIMRTDHL